MATRDRNTTVINGHGGRSPAELVGRPSATGPDETVAASMTSMVTFLAGVWLVVAPLVLAYHEDGYDFGGFAGDWNELSIGCLVMVFATARALMVRHLSWLTVPNIVSGAWLIVAPFVLGYGAESEAVLNDVITGVVVLVSAGGATALS